MTSYKDMAPTDHKGGTVQSGGGSLPFMPISTKGGGYLHEASVLT